MGIEQFIFYNLNDIPTANMYTSALGELIDLHVIGPTEDKLLDAPKSRV